MMINAEVATAKVATAAVGAAGLLCEWRTALHRVCKNGRGAVLVSEAVRGGNRVNRGGGEGSDWS